MLDPDSSKVMHCVLILLSQEDRKLRHDCKIVDWDIKQQQKLITLNWLMSGSGVGATYMYISLKDFFLS